LKHFNIFLKEILNGILNAVLLDLNMLAFNFKSLHIF